LSIQEEQAITSELLNKWGTQWLYYQN
jgi:hypothetical protein